ncbi:MAG: hypothetical protein A4E38_00392 [Methanoregulaceae archaeon PtaB.Bin108]|nr:MAG: hypothetical protein A4E38_00392 [Methanoregulaceae archaeon PtaB.Bin108]
MSDGALILENSLIKHPHSMAHRPGLSGPETLSHVEGALGGMGNGNGI